MNPTLEAKIKEIIGNAKYQAARDGRYTKADTARDTLEVLEAIRELYKDPRIK